MEKRETSKAEQVIPNIGHIKQMNISFSKTQLYSECGYKYKLQYIDKWSPDKTFTPLLFGISFDSAINYLLLRHKHHHTLHLETAQAIFTKYMNQWPHNELQYFKYEAPATCPTTGIDFEDLDHEAKQIAVHKNLIILGHKLITTYYTHIIPTFKKILSVQTKRFIPNESGDTLVLITDFRAELLDGRVVTFDNKTSSDIKKYYNKDSVKKSAQLAIYTEYEDTKLAGYIALQKKLVRGEVKYDIIVDEVDNKVVDDTFNNIDAALAGIKNNEFNKNEKSCFSFGNRCSFWDACKKNNYKGLVKRK